MAKEVTVVLDDSNDFGFSFYNEDEITSESDNEIRELKNRLKEIRQTYLPLLEHLSKDPDKPMIKWPNREGTLKKHIAKMIKLTEV